jgi:hypothetical protein
MNDQHEEEERRRRDRCGEGNLIIHVVNPRFGWLALTPAASRGSMPAVRACYLRIDFAEECVIFPRTG